MRLLVNVVTKGTGLFYPSPNVVGVGEALRGTSTLMNLSTDPVSTVQVNAERSDPRNFDRAVAQITGYLVPEP